MSSRATTLDEKLVSRLRAGDETAFASLVDALHGGLEAFARTFTSSPSLAEDIVQETWLAVIRGVHRFDERSSLKTWVYSILVRRARTLTVRDARQGGLRMNGLVPEGMEWEPGRGRVGLWDEAPVPWALEDPATIYQSAEALEVLQNALDALPEVQRQAVLLRDVEGLSASDVCNILGLTETNQRVVLHRGRARLRRALDRYARDGAMPPSSTARASAGGNR